jgi:GT2 family glycosyltransferase
MKDLSVIIVSYNTADITRQCLQSLLASLRTDHVSAEIIVFDNASTDNSKETIRTIIAENTDIPITLIESDTNLGFSKANNKALETVTGTYTLFLNSDVLVEQVRFSQLQAIMDSSPRMAGLTVRVSLPTGSIDPASHRGFPTLWRSACYFSGLELVFSKVPFLNKGFGGYHLTDRDMRTQHEIDSPSGAFFFVRTQLVKELGGFDEDFFMYGEDIDLAYRMKQQGHTIEYVPHFEVLHLKYSSGLRNKDVALQNKIRSHFYDAMRIFYKKHYDSMYPSWINKLIYKAIALKSKLS